MVAINNEKMPGIYSPPNFTHWCCSQVLKILEIISNNLLYIVTSAFPNGLYKKLQIIV